MFWDGTRWVDESPTPRAVNRPSKRRLRDWIATGAMGLALFGLLIPILGVAAATPSQTTRELREWSVGTTALTFQEGRARVHYRGSWELRAHPAYAGGLARSSDQSDARARIHFVGDGVAWVGPVGPTRGKARVYVDGELVTVVDTYAPHFQPSKVLFKTTFPEVGRHVLRISVVGTQGHPTVAVDQFAVRSLQSRKDASRPKSNRRPPSRTPDPGVTAAPTTAPTAAPTNAPTSAPTAAPTSAPTAAPTSAPTAAPTATPKPTATPAPTPAPTPASDTVNVPNSIDSSGGSDVSGALASFIGGLPDGTKIAFKSGGTYKLGKAIHLTNRHDLVFDGNGATLRIAGCSVEDSAFLLDGKPSTGIKIRQFKIVGDNNAAGTTGAFVAGCESQMGVAIYGARDIDISDMTISSVHAECVYIDAGGNPRGVGAWADGITFRDSTCRLTGRMGVALIAASHITVTRVTFERIAISVFDIEPYMADGGATNVSLTDNVIDGYGASPTYTPWILEGSAYGMTTTVVHDITLAGNRIIGGPTKSANIATMAGLAVKLRTERWKRVTISDNVSTVAGDGPVMYFEHIDGLTVTGNTQHLSGGSLVWQRDVTGATIR